MDINEKLIEVTENQRKMESYLQETKKAILGRGGNISFDADMDDLPEAIFNIPADSSLSHIEDSTVAYQKIVPEGAEEYALLKSVGGMTHKCNNLIPFPYFDNSKETNGITWTVYEDGSIRAKGTSIGISTFYLSRNMTFKNGVYYTPSVNSNNLRLLFCYIDENGETKWVTSTRLWNSSYKFVALYLQIPSGTTIDEIITPMFNEGTTALPFESYYEGLRDTKVTEIVSKGGNLFNENAITHVSNYSGTVAPEYGVVNKEDGYLEAKVSNAIDTIYWQPFCEHLDVDTYTISADIYIPSGKAPTLNVIMGVRSANDQSAYFRGKATISAYDNWERASVQVSVQTEDDYFCVLQPSLSESGNNSNLEVRLKNITIIRGTITEYTPYREPITYAIPEAVQALEGYGWGVNDTVYNYIDYTTKTFHKKVGMVDLGTLTYARYNEYTYFGNLATAYQGSFTAINAICDKLGVYAANYTPSDSNSVSASSTSKIKVRFADTSGFASVEEMLPYVQGVMLYYELPEEEITDISDILIDDNFLSVEGGGTLEFANEYNNAVPSTVKYTVKVGA